MDIRVPIADFLDHLKQVKEKHRDFPRLDQIGFLLDNFSFDDSSATYAPMPEHYTLKPATDWFLRHARN